jgi:hypothetical protein
MASFVLRKIDSELWQRVRSRCRLAGVTVTQQLENLLADWLKENPMAVILYTAKFYYEDRDQGTWDETEIFDALTDEGAQNEALELANSAFQQPNGPIKARIELTSNNENVATIECERDDHSPTIYEHR